MTSNQIVFINQVFSHQTITGKSWENAYLMNVDFSHAHLTEVSFRRTRAPRFMESSMSLMNVSFEGSLLVGVDFSHCKMMNVDFSDCVLDSCDFTSCDLMNCDVTNATSKKCVFSDMKAWNVYRRDGLNVVKCGF